MSNKNGILQDENGNSFFPKTFDFNIFNSNNQSLDNIIQGINNSLSCKCNIDLSNVDYENVYNAVKYILGYDLTGNVGYAIGTNTTSQTTNTTGAYVKLHVKDSTYDLLLCWGGIRSNGDSWNTVTYPYAYSIIPTVIVSKGRTSATGWGPQYWLCVSNNVNTTNFQLRVSDGDNRGNWFSIGWCQK